MELTFAAIFHTNKILEFATDLPKVVDIIDDVEKIDAFMPTLAALSGQTGTDGLITLKNVRVLPIENSQVKKV